MHDRISASIFPSSQRFREISEALMHLLQIDLSLADEISRSIQICEIKFGETISTESFYIVKSGRVRLISLDQKHCDVSVGTVEVGEVLGQDAIFSETALAYHAIATEDTQLIEVRDLVLWLDRLPHWRQIWTDQAIAREKLIFLKTQTDLGASQSHNQAVTSTQLRQLVPLLTEIFIRAGTPIVQSAANQGYCWLRSGEIEPPHETLQTWGNSAILPDWRAKTDLRIYQLPNIHWDTASEIVPALRSRLSSSTEATSKPPRVTARRQALPVTELSLYQGLFN